MASLLGILGAIGAAETGLRKKREEAEQLKAKNLLELIMKGYAPVEEPRYKQTAEDFLKTGKLDTTLAEGLIRVPEKVKPYLPVNFLERLPKQMTPLEEMYKEALTKESLARAASIISGKGKTSTFVYKGGAGGSKTIKLNAKDEAAVKISQEKINSGEWSIKDAIDDINKSKEVTNKAAVISKLKTYKKKSYEGREL